MKIKITEISQINYKADLLDLPGSPWIGRGTTKEEAVGSLFFHLLHPANKVKWIPYINFNEFKIE